MGKGGGKDTKKWVIVTLLVLVPFALFAIAKFVFAILYDEDCPLQKRVPTYLWVSAGIPYIMALGLASIKGSEIIAVLLGLLVITFNLIWTIVDTLQINDDFVLCNGTTTVGCTQHGCDNTLITFAFASINVDWIITIATVVLVVLVAVLVFREENSNLSQPTSNQPDSVPKLVVINKT